MGLKKLIQSAKDQTNKGKIQWPSTQDQKKKSKNEKGSFSNLPEPVRRNSVNIKTKRKESKKFMKSSNIKITDKSKWNHPYPIIEYNE